MLLESTEIIDRPLNEVYAFVRDDLTKLIPYMPNIENIEVVENQTVDNTVKLTNHWRGKADVPSLLKKFIKPELFSWKDRAVWNNDTLEVNYELESFMGNDLFDAKGTNTFTDAGNGRTQLKVSCEVIIYADKVPGVPKLLAKKITPAVETLIEKILGPNLTALGQGLNSYFKENHK